jgi:hypothetical protein
VYDWSNLVKEGRTVVENLRRLRLLQGTLWPVIFGIVKVSYSSMKIIIRRF